MSDDDFVELGALYRALPWQYKVRIWWARWKYPLGIHWKLRRLYFTRHTQGGQRDE